jgi:tetratricopeptide (TPR) repeat protein
MASLRIISVGLTFASMLALTASAFAQPAAPQAASAAESAPVDSLRANLLAARFAENRRDYPTALARVRAALQREPDNPDIVALAVRILVAAGDRAGAIAIARQALASPPTTSTGGGRVDREEFDRRVGANVAARFIMAADALARGEAAQAEQHLTGMPTQGYGGAFWFNVTGVALRGWSGLAQGNTAAIESMRLSAQIENRRNSREAQAAVALIAYHQALAAEQAGDLAAADRAYRRAMSAPSVPVRAIDTAVAFFRRQGQDDLAREILDNFRRDESDESRAPQIATPQAGAAEIFLNMANNLRGELSQFDSRGRERVISDMILFLQLGRWLDPALHPATLLLADLIENAGRHDDANTIYAQVPADHPLGWTARLRVAENLYAVNRVDDAVRALEAMAGERPERTDALIALGTLLRRAERYAQAADAYDRAVQRVPQIARGHWWLLYQRAISYERSQQWPKAEADFLRALELFPDQPDVLNYLAYSWIEQGAHYERAEQMLLRAVELSAQRGDNNGHIIDSLAWVYYRTGRFAQAVEKLEEAIRLLPLDATILDHLGDAYWMVGRREEARFQWRRALRNNPEAERRPQIERKLERGLEPVAQQGQGQPQRAN